MRKYLRDPDGSGVVGNKVLLDLIYGWGNETWSALDEYLAACIRRTLNSDGPILECGSGLSTLLLGAIAKRHGRSYIALEHIPEWANRVRLELDRYGINTVRLICVPLVERNEYSWYDVQLDDLPAAFELVICDGPPASTKGGRYGLLPTMRSRLRADCVIVLDDAGREQERETASRWKKELGCEAIVGGSVKPYIELRLASGAAISTPQ